MAWAAASPRRRGTCVLRVEGPHGRFITARFARELTDSADVFPLMRYFGHTSMTGAAGRDAAKAVCDFILPFFGSGITNLCLSSFSPSESSRKRPVSTSSLSGRGGGVAGCCGGVASGSRGVVHGSRMGRGLSRRCRGGVAAVALVSFSVKPATVTKKPAGWGGDHGTVMARVHVEFGQGRKSHQP